MHSDTVTTPSFIKILSSCYDRYILPLKVRIAVSQGLNALPYCKDLLLESNLSFIACPLRSLSIFSFIS